MGENEKAIEIIDIYASERKDNPEVFNLEEVNFWGDIKDSDVVAKFNDVYQRSVTTETAKEVLERIAGRNGWNQSDEVVLSNASIDDYYNLFKSEVGEHLSRYVRACLQFGELSNPNENCKLIAKKAKGALKQIASESEINRLRVKKFGVEP